MQCMNFLMPGRWFALVPAENCPAAGAACQEIHHRMLNTYSAATASWHRAIGSP